MFRDAHGNKLPEKQPFFSVPFLMLKFVINIPGTKGL